MKKLKYIFALVLMVFTAGVIFTACGNQNPEESQNITLELGDYVCQSFEYKTGSYLSIQDALDYEGFNSNNLDYFALSVKENNKLDLIKVSNRGFSKIFDMTCTRENNTLTAKRFYDSGEVQDTFEFEIIDKNTLRYSCSNNCASLLLKKKDRVALTKDYYSDYSNGQLILKENVANFTLKSNSQEKSDVEVTGSYAVIGDNFYFSVRNSSNSNISGYYVSKLKKGTFYDKDFIEFYDVRESLYEKVDTTPYILTFYTNEAGVGGGFFRCDFTVLGRTGIIPYSALFVSDSCKTLDIIYETTKSNGVINGCQLYENIPFSIGTEISGSHGDVFITFEIQNKELKYVWDFKNDRYIQRITPSMLSAYAYYRAENFSFGGIPTLIQGKMEDDMRYVGDGHFTSAPAVCDVRAEIDEENMMVALQVYHDETDFPYYAVTGKVYNFSDLLFIDGGETVYVGRMIEENDEKMVFDGTFYINNSTEEGRNLGFDITLYK